MYDGTKDPESLAAHLQRPGILLFTELFPPMVGGSAELLGNVYRRLRRTDVTVLTQASPSSPEKPREAFQVISSPIATDAWGLLSLAGLRYHWRRSTQVRRLSRSPCRIVHCGRAIPEGVSARLARALGGAPYACWAHGEEIAYGQDSRELGRLLRAAYRSASGVFANSRNTARLIVAAGIDPARVHVVYPGVDAERFRPDLPGAAELKRRHAPAGEFLVVTVGRLQRRKGHDLVLQALAAIERDSPPIRYLIVGEGEDRGRLERMAVDLGLQNRVTFAGAVAADQLPVVYAAADLFVHPNRTEKNDFEGFGLVFLEAAAAGVASIGGSSGGTPEAVANGETGVLVSGTDVSELKSAIVGLLLSEERRRMMGDRGRRRVLSDFLWERTAVAVEELHERAFVDT